MLARLKLKKGEGKLVESPVVGSSGRRKRFPKSSTRVHPQIAEVAIESSETMSRGGEPVEILNSLTHIQWRLS